MRARVILAVDPGASGGLAWCDPQGRVVCDPMPDTDGELLAYLENIVTAADGAEHVTAHVERVGGFVGKAQPGSAMFRFGRGYGFLLGCLLALRVRTELVTPQRWQKALCCGTAAGLSRGDWKRKLRSQAERLFPAQRVTLATADALLLLEYARRTESTVRL
jgi:crossover junction endodeoxyribonuclease RuvC